MQVMIVFFREGERGGLFPSKRSSDSRKVCQSAFLVGIGLS